MGLGLVGAGAAVPAAAASDTTEPCADFSAQIAATGNVTANWYQDCVPQYGLGKAEFSIVADEDDPTAEFPAEFIPLDELPPEAITTTGDTAAQSAYFDGAPIGSQSGTPIFVADSNLSDPTEQRYFASVIAPVTSIAAVDLATGVPANIAAACPADDFEFAGGWVATFAPVDTTYSQVVDGEDWNYTITSSALPTYFFATFEDGIRDWCVTDGLRTLDSATSFFPGEQVFSLVMNNVIDFESEEIVDLGVFSRDLPEPVIPAVVVAAELPATGAEIMPLAIAAGSFTAFGLALLGFVNFAGRRRSRV